LSQNTRTENYYEGQTHGQGQENLDLTLHTQTTRTSDVEKAKKLIYSIKK